MRFVSLFMIAPLAMLAACTPQPQLTCGPQDWNCQQAAQSNNFWRDMWLYQIIMGQPSYHSTVYTGAYHTGYAYRPGYGYYRPSYAPSPTTVINRTTIVTNHVAPAAPASRSWFASSPTRYVVTPAKPSSYSWASRSFSSPSSYSGYSSLRGYSSYRSSYSSSRSFSSGRR